MDALAERRITCPYCWEPNSVLLDLSVPAQELIEDCQVCCQPMQLRFGYDAGSGIWIEVERAQ